jgi:hypothetical protein
MASPAKEKVIVSRPGFLLAALIAWRSEHWTAVHFPSTSASVTTTKVIGAAATGPIGSVALTSAATAPSLRKRMAARPERRDGRPAPVGRRLVGMAMSNALLRYGRRRGSWYQSPIVTVIASRARH